MQGYKTTVQGRGTDLSGPSPAPKSNCVQSCINAFCSISVGYRKYSSTLRVTSMMEKTLRPEGVRREAAGGGGGHKALVSDCLPLAVPIGLSPLLVLTLCGPERVLVVSTEPPDDLSCLTTPGVGRPGDGLLPRAVDQVHPDAHSKSMRGFADSSTDLCAQGCASAGSCSC